MAEEYALQLHHISKSFPGVKALDDVSFNIRKGTVHSIVGENGAGKSTLMKILNGMYKPDDGEIFVNGKKEKVISPGYASELGITMIFQELVYVPGLSVAENLCLGKQPLNRIGLIDWKKTNKNAQMILDLEDIKVKPTITMDKINISDAQMIEIVKATTDKATVFIMDEPTSSLTHYESEKLYDKIKRLRSSGYTIVFISHKLEEVFKLSDYVTVMRDGKSIITAPIGEFTENDVISMMVGRKVENIYPIRTTEPGEIILEVKNLIRGGIFNDINMFVRAGEIVGMAGLVGAGRTEIVRAISGLDPYDSGEVTVRGKKVPKNSVRAAIGTGLVMATEDRRKFGIISCRSIKENISLPNLKKISPKAILNLRREKEEVKKFYDRLRIKANSINTEVYTLSGGNQQKVILARWLMSNSCVFLLDEPTRGIDVGAKYEIYEIMNEMAAKGMAVIMVSSELPELLSMCDRTYVVSAGKIVGEISKEEMTQENVMKLATGGR